MNRVPDILPLLSGLLAGLRKSIPPLNREGVPFVAVFAIITLGLFWMSNTLGWIGTVLTVWCFAFFRDPKRVTPMRDGLVIAPADGVVQRIVNAVPPRELELGDAPRTRVAIFMSMFDCHVNRAPISGRIERVAYKAGAFLSADLDKASEDNERNGVVIATQSGAVLGVVQIAGLVARRIVCWVKEGEQVGTGERFGMIRFGSRVDVYLPQGARVLVGEGQTTVAGETPIADLTFQPGLMRDTTFRVS
ncbi:MAG: phosphatidylserine decarboxylase [Blastochloris sp.]|nr:phosphatidylserine decarboxylase [Blastochloris sp.]